MKPDRYATGAGKMSGKRWVLPDSKTYLRVGFSKPARPGVSRSNA
ncbi:hypothetical protein PAMC26510_09945 [Caballeronia sordidicola]|uniref:Uncharacterized protein n=1 Tax=Caballeronia sordidicola TaxID=196367 RepID=A0A242N001_CABSO|nr:hypothetical protein PAMC26510_09945 [Caballeronia sordidicola]